MKLMNPDGTTLQDGRHDLVVYKVVRKKEAQNIAEDIFTLSKTGSENSFQTYIYIHIDSFSRPVHVCPFKSRALEHCGHTSSVASHPLSGKSMLH